MARIPTNRVIRLGVSLGEPQRRKVTNQYVEAEGICDKCCRSAVKNAPSNVEEI